MTLHPADVQHVYIDPTGAWAHPEVGILMGWRRDPDGWMAHVVIVTQAAPAHGADPRVRIEWVPADSVRAAKDGVPVPTWRPRPVGTQKAPDPSEVEEPGA